MLMNIARNIDRWLRAHQDPRYRNLPIILPRVWRGSGSGLSAEDIARLNFNVRDIGLDPTVVSQQPHNQMLLKMSQKSRQRPEVRS